MNHLLGVNVDHIASVRQLRKGCLPDPVEAALVCQKAGADSVVAHLREDRRHIREEDLRGMKKELRIPLNMEMSIALDIVDFCCALKPFQATLVPERRQELTTEGGLDVAGQRKELAPVVASLRKAGISVSMFIDPELRQVEAAAEIGAPYIELHTGAYAGQTCPARELELGRLIAAAQRAHEVGLKVNAGHGLSLDNLGPILSVPYLDTLNIGHSIVCHALFVGLEQAVREMLGKMRILKE